jgi:hypothetical protein
MTLWFSRSIGYGAYQSGVVHEELLTRSLPLASFAIARMPISKFEEAQQVRNSRLQLQLTVAVNHPSGTS